MKKIISTVLMATVAISMLAGCSKSSSNSDAAKGDSFEISMLYSDNASYPYKADWKVWDIIKEHTGATINVQAVPESDYEAKKQIVFNSGDIPDIITKTFASEEDGLSGLLLPISQYEDQMPNYKKFLEESGMRAEIERTRLSDGNYYTLPVNAHRTRLQDQQWLIRKDVFEKNNIPVPTTLEEMYEAGKKLKQIYPNSTPIINRFGSGNIMTAFAGGFGTSAGWTLENGEYYDAKTDSWVFGPATDNWKNMLKFTNKLFKDGVLDQEFATLDSTVYEQKVTKGDAFILYDWTGNIKRYNLQGKQNDANYNMTPIYPLKGEDGKYALSWKSQATQGWVFPATLKDKKNFKDILKFIDWCYTDEAEKLLTFGIEGETYKEENGVLKYVDDNVDYNAVYGLNNNCLAVRQHSDFLFSSLSKEQIDLFDKIAKDDCVPMPNPKSPLSADDMDKSKVYTSTLTDYANSTMENYIFGKESVDNWDKTVKEFEAKGSTKLTDLYNNAWKNRKK
ncbi:MULTISPECIES: extracellular solute-binding protein [Bacteria]|uniref:extracellular solute-binding protein n=1 Tax=Bacteria TaxID=2 RepID=UPI0013611FFD|nr:MULTISPECIES: extracellular solute-binding protein [Bacteria]MZK52061.1 extracellular solute-binding protein [Clostridium beijerinckii]MZK60202.1 extracellular solute-binding protein [Clostridium beijerinckii]MZK70487.1 extracellular solute-binding protein [Clostridium beijerinckii]MZK75789.1 extracellular solute-binding protein [Clostridium beijerinckii]MZK85453.1 extracellular solute-binding protein [Clostridium beijerinckii]